MDISQSQFSSGCESGWTHYLDQSFLSGSHGMQRANDYVGAKLPEVEEQEEQEEDLSMVSDASSGPPHYHELIEDGRSFSVNSSKSGKKSKKKKKNTKGSRGREQHHHLDDTASSSVLNYYSKKKMSTICKDESSMENVPDYSEGFSATNNKGKCSTLVS